MCRVFVFYPAAEHERLLAERDPARRDGTAVGSVPNAMEDPAMRSGRNFLSSMFLTASRVQFFN